MSRCIAVLDRKVWLRASVCRVQFAFQQRCGNRKWGPRRCTPRRVATSVATWATFSSRLGAELVFRKWCARQESSLLPCGPEMANLPFGLSSLNSRCAAERRQLRPIPGKIAVSGLIRSLSGWCATRPRILNWPATWSKRLRQDILLTLSRRGTNRRVPPLLGSRCRAGPADRLRHQRASKNLTLSGARTAHVTSASLAGQCSLPPNQGQGFGTPLVGSVGSDEFDHDRGSAADCRAGAGGPGAAAGERDPQECVGFLCGRARRPTSEMTRYIRRSRGAVQNESGGYR